MVSTVRVDGVLVTCCCLDENSVPAQLECGTGGDSTGWWSRFVSDQQYDVHALFQHRRMDERASLPPGDARAVVASRRRSTCYLEFHICDM